MLSLRSRSTSTTRRVPSTEGPSSSLVIKNAIVPRCAGWRRTNSSHGGDHGREAALHIGRTAPVQEAVRDHGVKGIAAPLIQRPRRHHIGVAGEAEHRSAGPALGPEIVHRPEAQVLDGEAYGLEAIDHQRLAAAVGGTDRRACNQLLRQHQGIGLRRRRHQKRSTGAWRRRLIHTPKTPKHRAAMSTQPGIASPKKLQVTLGAFARAGQHLDQHLAQREHLEHEIERGPAGRHAALGQALDVQMPHRHPDGGERGKGEERRHTRACPRSPGRAPPRSGRAGPGRTRRLAERCTAGKAPGAGRLARSRHRPAVPRRPANPRRFPCARAHQLRARACAASICLATSSSEVWRMSLPCTM